MRRMSVDMGIIFQILPNVTAIYDQSNQLNVCIFELFEVILYFF